MCVVEWQSWQNGKACKAPSECHPGPFILRRLHQVPFIHTKLVDDCLADDDATTVYPIVKSLEIFRLPTYVNIKIMSISDDLARFISTKICSNELKQRRQNYNIIP